MIQIISSIADPNNFDPDPNPAFHFDSDSDQTFHFDSDSDPTFHFETDPDTYCFKEIIYLKPYLLLIVT